MSVTDSTVADLREQAIRWVRIGAWSVALVGSAGTLMLLSVQRQYAAPFAAIALMTWGAVQFWSRGARGLPLLPLLALQHAVIYGTPLLVRNPSIEPFNPAVLSRSVLVLFIATASACAAWKLGSGLLPSHGSRLELNVGSPSSGTDRLLSLALALLCFATLFELTALTGSIWQWLPGTWSGLYPVLRSFAGAASSLGAMLGAVALRDSRNRFLRVAFWCLFWAEFLLAIRDILISGATMLVVGLLLGLSIGRKRMPLRFLIFTTCLIAFLNFGKFAMREKYGENGTRPRPSLQALPAFYVEWANESLRLMGLRQLGDQNISILNEQEQGQSLFMRLDSLQTLLFVVDALDSGGIEPLHGRSYRVIPTLLVPRFFWEDKPRTHEGQVLLNIYFGRQAGVEATEQTYVAWGLLPEAVGNFGPFWGAIAFGLAAGFACGLIEVWSARKKLLSVEGFLCLALLIQSAGSFEMVGSVLVTSTFQLACAVLLTGLVVRLMLNPVTHAKPPSRSSFTLSRQAAKPNPR